jgi:hypothetical protein
MHGAPRNRFDRLPGFLAPILLAAMATTGCGNGNPSGDFVPPAKEAAQRQKDMYNFMKEQGKGKAPRTAARAR